MQVILRPELPTHGASNNQDFKSSYPGPFQVRKKRVTLTVGKEADTHADFTSCLQDLNSLKGAKQLVQMKI